MTDKYETEPLLFRQSKFKIAKAPVLVPKFVSQSNVFPQQNLKISSGTDVSLRNKDTFILKILHDPWTSNIFLHCPFSYQNDCIYTTGTYSGSEYTMGSTLHDAGRFKSEYVHNVITTEDNTLTLDGMLKILL